MRTLKKLYSKQRNTKVNGERPILLNEEQLNRLTHSVNNRNKQFWRTKVDVTYCNKKIDQVVNKVLPTIIAHKGIATVM